jgi:hypothetical protein
MSSSRQPASKRARVDKPELHQFSTIRCPAFVAVILSMLAAACSDGAEPSAETQYLETMVVPKIELWAKDNSELFPFAFTTRERSYDKVCLVPGYWGLASLEKLADEPIKRYHSSFGDSVPENFAAVVALKDGNAHAALIRSRRIGLGAAPGKYCVPATHARLRRQKGLGGYTPTAILE